MNLLGLRFPPQILSTSSRQQEIRVELRRESKVLRIDIRVIVNCEAIEDGDIT